MGKLTYFKFDDPASYPPHPLFGNHAAVIVSRQTPPDQSSERFIRVGVGIKNGKKTPAYSFWKDFCEYFAHLAEQRDQRIKHAETMSELSEMNAIRSDLRFEGSLQMANGEPIRILYPFAIRPDAPFVRALQRLAQ